MSSRQTQDEILAQRRASMGAELGELHFLLWKEIVDLHVRWNVYRGLFASAEDRFDLMNATAPRFFFNLDRMMWHDVLLHLARLTDPPASVGKNNLTVRALEASITDSNLAREIHDLVEDARTKTDFARDWRNRHLAHRDLTRAKNPKVHKLAAASRAHVEEAIATLRDVLNQIQFFFEGSRTHFEGTVTAAGGSEALMYFLKKGHEFEMAERARKLGKSQE